MKNLILILSMTLLTACSVETTGTVAKDSLNKTTQCTDTRDGEVFTFKNSDIRNVRHVFGGETCFDVIDRGGKDRHLCSAMELYLKCGNIK